MRGDTTFTAYVIFLSVNTMVHSLLLIFPKTHVDNTNKNIDILIRNWATI